MISFRNTPKCEEKGRESEIDLLLKWLNYFSVF